MRDVPELTFRGALGVLGHYDRPVLDRLNTLLGGVIVVAGAVALTGSTAAPVVAIAALWGWMDQKNEALGLVRKLLDKIGDRRAAARALEIKDKELATLLAKTGRVASEVIYDSAVPIPSSGRGYTETSATYENGRSGSR